MVQQQGKSIESRRDDKTEEYLQQQIDPCQAFREFAPSEIERSLWESFSQNEDWIFIKNKKYSSFPFPDPSRSLKAASFWKRLIMKTL